MKKDNDLSDKILLLYENFKQICGTCGCEDGWSVYSEKNKVLFLENNNDCKEIKQYNLQIYVCEKCESWGVNFNENCC